MVGWHRTGFKLYWHANLKGAASDWAKANFEGSPQSDIPDGSVWFVGIGRSSGTAEPLAHVKRDFSFIVKAPMEVASPLFGPDAERGWAGDGWNPQFFYPQSGRDVPCAVFPVRHGQHESI